MIRPGSVAGGKADADAISDLLGKHVPQLEWQLVRLGSQFGHRGASVWPGDFVTDPWTQVAGSLDAARQRLPQVFTDIENSVRAAAAAEDLEARLDAVMACKSFLQEAARLRSGVASAPRRHMAALFRSVLTNTYAEELTEAQLAALRESAAALVSRDITEADVRAASARLRGAGLEVIPSVSEQKRIEVLKSLGINIDD